MHCLLHSSLIPVLQVSHACFCVYVPSRICGDCDHGVWGWMFPCPISIAREYPFLHASFFLCIPNSLAPSRRREHTAAWTAPRGKPLARARGAVRWCEWVGCTCILAVPWVTCLTSYCAWGLRSLLRFAPSCYAGAALSRIRRMLVALLEEIPARHLAHTGRSGFAKPSSPCPLTNGGFNCVAALK